MIEPTTYDAQQTMAMVETARKRMMQDHGLLDDKYGDDANGAALRMQEHNQNLAEAAARIRELKAQRQEEAAVEMQQSRKKSTVKQRVVMPVKVAPSKQEIEKLPEMEHVNVLSSKTEPPKQNHAETKVTPIEIPQKSVVKPAKQKPAEQLPVEPAPIPEPVHAPVVEPAQVAIPSPAPQSVQLTNNADVVNAPAVNYDAFTQITNLPSGGHFYEGPIYGQALKLIDMLLLDEIRSYNAVDIFSEILARRIRGVAPEDIMLCDEAYILQWLRASSFPNQNMPVPGFDCTNEECKYKLRDPEYAINFKNLSFTTNVNPSECASHYVDGIISITFSDGTKCDIYPRRRYHAAMLSKWRNDYFDAHEEFPRPALINIVNTAAIIEIGGCDTLEAKIRYMSELSREDSKLLYTTIAQNDIVTTISVNHTCPKCGGRVTTPYPFRLDTYISGL